MCTFPWAIRSNSNPDHVVTPFSDEEDEPGNDFVDESGGETTGAETTGGETEDETGAETEFDTGAETEDETQDKQLGGVNDETK